MKYRKKNQKKTTPPKTLTKIYSKIINIKKPLLILTHLNKLFQQTTIKICVVEGHDLSEEEKQRKGSKNIG